MGCYLCNFGGTYSKIYACFEQKTAFVMQIFQNLGPKGGDGDHFLMKPPKGTSLADFTRLEPLCVQIHAIGRKKGHYKKSRSSYISSICREIPTQPNLTKIGV